MTFFSVSASWKLYSLYSYSNWLLCVHFCRRCVLC